MNDGTSGAKWNVWDWLIGLGVISLFLIQIVGGALGSLLVVWSVLIAFAAWGIIPAVLCVTFPVVAQGVLAIYMWVQFGFFNPYTIACAVFVALVVFTLAAYILFGFLSDRYGSQ